MEYNIFGIQGILQFNEYAISVIEKIVISFLIVVICYITIKISNFIILKLFYKEDPKLGVRRVKTLCTLLSSMTKYLICFIGLFQIFSVFGVKTESLLAVAGVGSIAIGLGAQSLIKDVVTGFFIVLEDYFGVSDIISVEGITGTVEEISIRSTKIRCDDGSLAIIPNGSISTIKNLSNKFSCAIVEVYIHSSENIEEVIRILNSASDECLNKIEGIKDKPIVLGITSQVTRRLIIRIKATCEVKQNFRIERELKELYLNRLSAENISVI